MAVTDAGACLQTSAGLLRQLETAAHRFLSLHPQSCSCLYHTTSGPGGAAAWLYYPTPFPDTQKQA